MTLAIIILICILLSFLLSGMETGVLMLNHARIRYMKEQGSFGARILLDLFMYSPARLSSTVLIGNTIMSGVSTVLVAIHFLEQDGPLLSGAAVFLFALCMWLFGELVPKALFQRFPNRFTTLLAPLLLIIYVALWPIVTVSVWISQLFIRLMGGKPRSGRMFVTRDELKVMARASERGVALSGEQSNLIASILDSQKSTALEIMKPRNKVLAIPHHLSERERLKLALEKGVSRIPVLHSNNPEGNWDGVWVAYDSLFHQNVALRNPPFIPENTPLEDILSILRNARSSIGFVRDSSGRDIGIVTVEDVLRRYIGKIDL